MSGPTVWRFGEEIGPVDEAVRAGRIVAIPTESSYGLAVDPRDERAVRRVFEIKGRPAGEPLPVVVGNAAQIEALGGRLDDPIVRRLTSLWPAPLSVLVPLSVPLAAAAGSGRLACRIPDHPGLRQLLEDLGMGLTATSANRSGDPALTDPRRVAELLQGAPGSVLIDDGVLPGGNPSTLVGVREGTVEILRAGRIGSGDIDRLLDPDGDDRR